MKTKISFRRKRSAILQMLAFLKNVYEYSDNIEVEELAILYLDFEKTFDKVPHGPFNSKLSQNGITGEFLKILEKYNHNRMQIVKINESLSCLLLVPSGVPQSSIVGPLFFILFVNDLPENLTECPIFSHSDNMKMVSCKSDPLRSNNKSLESCCEENKMF